MDSKVSTIVRKLRLEPHPEGGYFRETYRSTGIISADQLKVPIKGDRNYSTLIYFLLTSDHFSAFHRINQDESWHFYQGSPITIHMITENGQYHQTTIGMDIDDGLWPQFVVPARCWFAAEVTESASYGLVGCGVSPGFDFRDFELAGKDQLIALYPRHKQLISSFTRTK